MTLAEWWQVNQLFGVSEGIYSTLNIATPASQIELGCTAAKLDMQWNLSIVVTLVEWSLCSAATTLLQQPISSSKWCDCIHLHLCKAVTSISITDANFQPIRDRHNEFHCTELRYWLYQHSMVWESVITEYYKANQPLLLCWMQIH